MKRPEHLQGSAGQFKQFEQLTHDTLRDLPLQPAPQSLQACVLATLERRARKAWWQKSFSLWPLPARIVLLCVCAALAKVSVDASLWAASSTHAELWPFTTMLSVLFSLYSSLIVSIPSLWWYGALTALALTCAAAFGIGTIAYRTLYATR